MLKRIKQGGLKSAKSLRLLDLVGKSRWRTDRLLILGYHGVSLDDEHVWNPELFMPAELLRRRFQIIKESRCTVLGLGDALQRLYSGTLPAKTVVITFDDGFYNFHKVAVPLLGEFNFPATLYLTTFYTDYNKPIFGIAADYLLWKGKSSRLNCSSLLEIDEVIDLNIDSERLRCHRLIIDYALKRELSAEQKNSLLMDLCSELNIDFATFCETRLFQLMTSQEVSQAAERVNIELHTHRHRVPLDERLFAREIDDNRRAIGRATASRPTHFCYPSGQYNSLFFPWLETADVVSATTCDPALATATTSNFLLPRLIDTCSLTDVEFEGWLSGVSHFLPQRRYA
jgi:peptidoglycan/xylan/chitin deacetylase (PgdA/CDA1 family)